MKVSLLICLLCTQFYLRLTQGSKEDIINNIFGITEPPETIQSCGINEVCVPRLNCLNGSPNVGGKLLIDIKANSATDCEDLLSVCCSVKDILPAPVPDTISSKCGIRNSEGVRLKLKGADREAEFGEFPWMVAILSDDSIKEGALSFSTCGGSIIAKNVVLTAAHCVANKNPLRLMVRAGEWDFQTKREPFREQDRRVAEIIIHEYFDRKALYNDIALLITDVPFEYQYHIQPICLPDSNQNFDFKRCYATGWGKDEFGPQGKYQVILKKIDLPIVPKQNCQAKLRSTRLGNYFVLDPSFACAGGDGGADTCTGDGGSPLVCPIDEQANQYAQIGIVAYGVGCGNKNVPGVYADVAYLRSWIDYNLRSRNIDT